MTRWRNTFLWAVYLLATNRINIIAFKVVSTFKINPVNACVRIDVPKVCLLARPGGDVVARCRCLCEAVRCRPATRPTDRLSCRDGLPDRMWRHTATSNTHARSTALSAVGLTSASALAPDETRLGNCVLHREVLQRVYHDNAIYSSQIRNFEDQVENIQLKNFLL